MALLATALVVLIPARAHDVSDQSATARGDAPAAITVKVAELKGRAGYSGVTGSKGLVFPSNIKSTGTSRIVGRSTSRTPSDDSKPVKPMSFGVG